MEEAELKNVTESLYKQNQELAVKNKTLSLLGKLYDISLIALKPTELANNIVRAVEEEFQYELVAILNYSYHHDRLYSLAILESPRLEQTGDMKFSSSAIAIDDASTHQFFGRVIANRTMGYTENLSEIWAGIISDELITKVVSEGHVRSSICYPLVSEGKIIWVLVIELNRSYDKLANYEKKSMESIANVAAIAMEKSILYERLEITNEELSQANDRQEGLIHFISHQIKGYLTKSQGAFAGIIEGDYGETSDSIKNVAKLALADNREGVETVQSILNASNLKKGTVSFEKAPFNFRKALEETIEARREEATKRGLNLAMEIQPAEYIFVGDKEKLVKHVISNLLDNALKYTLHGGLSIKLSKEPGKILFSVTDTGVGITPDDKRRLFTEGGKGKDSTKINVDSTGYGLFIAKQVVEAHGGKIWVESEGAGKGSTFFVALPVS